MAVAELLAGLELAVQLVVVVVHVLQEVRLQGRREWMRKIGVDHNTSAGHTPAPLYITNWNSDDDTAIEQSEATSDAWTPTPIITPHSEEASDIEYDADWAENVSIRLRHHVLEEGLEHHPWEHYSEEDFFN